MKIAVVVDSTSYLPEGLKKKYDIRTIPLNVVIGDTAYREDEDIDADVTTNQAEEWQEDEDAEELAVPSQTVAPEIPGTPVPQPSPSVYFPDNEIHDLPRHV